MKKLIFILSFAAILTACGGGGSESSNTNSNNSSVTETVKPNTAPTLSGIFSLTAPAKNTASLVINASDAEGDALSATIKDKPDWLTMTFENNQVSVSVDAGFFDIGEYTFELSIADASLSTSYDLNIVVEDNPSQYNYPVLNSANVPSHWLLETGERLHFYSDGSGLYKESGGEMYGIEWSVFSDGIRASLLTAENETLRIEGLVQEGDMYRLNIERDGEPDQRVNTKPVSSLPLETAIFGVPKRLSSHIIQVNTENRLISGRINGATTSSISFSGQYGNDLAITLEQADINIGLEQIPFYNNFTRGNENLLFDKVVTSVMVDFYDGQLLILKANYKYELNEENSDITVAYYTNLEDHLKLQEATYFEAVKLTRAEFPILKVGDTYISQFNAPITIEGVEHRGSANELILDSTTTGTLITEVLEPNEARIETSIQWSLADNTLTISNEVENREYNLYTTQSGESVLVGFGQESDNSENSFELLNYTPFIKADNADMTKDMFVGTYLESSFNDIRDTDPQYIGVLENERMDYFYSLDLGLAASDFWKQNDDGSFQILSNFPSQCTSVSSFDECLSSRLAQREDGTRYTIIIRKVTPVKIEGDKHYFKYEYMYDGEINQAPAVFANSTIRLWTRQEIE